MIYRFSAKRDDYTDFESESTRDLRLKMKQEKWKNAKENIAVGAMFFLVLGLLGGCSRACYVSVKEDVEQNKKTEAKRQARHDRCFTLGGHWVDDQCVEGKVVPLD